MNSCLFKKALSINGKTMHVVLNKTKTEWEKEYSANGNCWDISLEDILLDGIKINEDIWYWLIDGRVYETTEEVEEEDITQVPLDDKKYVSKEVGTIKYEFCEETLDILYNVFVYLGWAKKLSREEWKKLCKMVS